MSFPSSVPLPLLTNIIYIGAHVPAEGPPSMFTKQACATRAEAEKMLQPSREPLFQAKRNDPCPCLSGKKFKKCCMGKVKQSGID